MAYVINGSCVSCGACAGECPVGAISEGDGKYVIDAGACIECGACKSSTIWAPKRDARVRAPFSEKRHRPWRTPCVPLRCPYRAALSV